MNNGPIMKRTFTAVVKQDSGWWIGWVAEIPGVNSQGKTRSELRRNLRSALKEALEFNRADALSAAKSNYEEEPILVSSSVTSERQLGLGRGRNEIVMRKKRLDRKSVV